MFPTAGSLEEQMISVPLWDSRSTTKARVSPDSPLYWGLTGQKLLLNHGGHGAVPLPTQNLLSELQEEFYRLPNSFAREGLAERLEHSRVETATLLNIPNENLTFIPNVSFAISSALLSLSLATDDEVLITSHAHPCIISAVQRLVRERGVTVKAVPLPFSPTETEYLSLVLQTITPRTKVALIEHISCFSGTLFPLDTLLPSLHVLDVLTFIDGAHAPGQIQLQGVPQRSDLYVGTLHKWCGAPYGTGFLQTSDRLVHKINPCISGKTAIRHPSFPTPKLAERFRWIGSDHYVRYLAIPHALKTLGSLYPDGWIGYLRRNQLLATDARTVLEKCISGSRTVPSAAGTMFVPLVVPLGRNGSSLRKWCATPYLLTKQTPEGHTIQIELQGDDKINAWFQHKAGIDVAAWRDHAHLYVRLSAYCYNSLADFHRFADALVKFLEITGKA